MKLDDILENTDLMYKDSDTTCYDDEYAISVLQEKMPGYEFVSFDMDSTPLDDIVNAIAKRTIGQTVYDIQQGTYYTDGMELAMLFVGIKTMDSVLEYRAKQRGIKCLH